MSSATLPGGYGGPTSAQLNAAGIRQPSSASSFDQLNAYVRRYNGYQSPNAQPLAQNQAARDANAQTQQMPASEKRKLLGKDIQRPGVNLSPYQQQQLLRQRQRDAQNQARNRIQRRTQLFGAIGRVGAVAAARRTSDRVGQAPTPGGIPLMLFILGFFLLVMLPVNGGYTRLGLIWLALLGRVSLPPSGPPADVSLAQGALNQLGQSASLGVSDVVPGATPGVPFSLPSFGQVGAAVQSGLGLAGVHLPGNLSGAFG